MALIKCNECGKEISSNATACPQCGNPMNVIKVDPKSGTYCRFCKTHVSPVVSSYGGGTCSISKRDVWKCPQCKKVIHRSGCFVATITYGDEDLIEVRFLRAFRDEYLKSTFSGRLFITVYYKIGAYIARAVELLPILKPPCRIFLDTIVHSIEKHTHLKRSNFRNPLP